MFTLLLSRQLLFIPRAQLFISSSDFECCSPGFRRQRRLSPDCAGFRRLMPPLSPSLALPWLSESHYAFFRSHFHGAHIFLSPFPFTPVCRLMSPNSHHAISKMPFTATFFHSRPPFVRYAIAAIGLPVAHYCYVILLCCLVRSSFSFSLQVSHFIER